MGESTKLIQKLIIIIVFIIIIIIYNYCMQVSCYIGFSFIAVSQSVEDHNRFVVLIVVVFQVVLIAVVMTIFIVVIVIRYKTSR